MAFKPELKLIKKKVRELKAKGFTNREIPAELEKLGIKHENGKPVTLYNVQYYLKAKLKRSKKKTSSKKSNETKQTRAVKVQTTKAARVLQQITDILTAPNLAEETRVFTIKMLAEKL